jgi:hypothetical protein
MTTTRTHFTFRVDTWTSDGKSIVEHVAGVEDYEIALATFRAACQRWPGIPITLRQLVRCNHPVAGTRISQSRITFVTKPSTSAITMPKPLFGRCFAF